MPLQRQTVRQEGLEGPGQKQRTQNNTAATPGKAECAASLALTMLLMLKRYLKASYSMSEERIAAFSPDQPDKRKQVCSLAPVKQIQIVEQHSSVILSTPGDEAC